MKLITNEEIKVLSNATYYRLIREAIKNDKKIRVLMVTKLDNGIPHTHFDICATDYLLVYKTKNLIDCLEKYNSVLSAINEGILK